MDAVLIYIQNVKLAAKKIFWRGNRKMKKSCLFIFLLPVDWVAPVAVVSIRYALAPCRRWDRAMRIECGSGSIVSRTQHPRRRAGGEAKRLWSREVDGSARIWQ